MVRGDLVEVEVVEGASPEVPILVSQAVQVPHALSHGTRDALLRGKKRLVGSAAKAAEEPHLPLAGFGSSSYAHPDPCRRLAIGEVYVLREKKEYEGEARMQGGWTIGLSWLAGAEVSKKKM